MKSKLDKYWGKFESMNMLLIVVVALDIRYKMKYVNYALFIAYGSLFEKIISHDVINVLKLLHKHYVILSLKILMSMLKMTIA